MGTPANMRLLNAKSCKYETDYINCGGICLDGVPLDFRVVCDQQEVGDENKKQVLILCGDSQVQYYSGVNVCIWRGGGFMSFVWVARG